jgi:hypothetical protein
MHVENWAWEWLAVGRRELGIDILKAGFGELGCVYHHKVWARDFEGVQPQT